MKTDKKAQSVTVEGTIEAEKLTSFLRKKVNKKAEVISIKEETKKEEKKDKGKEEGKSSESTKDKDKSKSGTESTKKKDNDKSAGESTKEKGIGKSSGETFKVIEIHHRETQEEIKIKENVPYIIHYVYAPQLFSDENPNSCCVM